MKIIVIVIACMIISPKLWEWSNKLIDNTVKPMKKQK